MKRTLLFSGTGTAMVTPFNRSGGIDEKALRRHVDFQIAGGVDALLPAGTTGESVTLTEEEQARLIAIVVEQARGRVPVIAGAGSNSTHKSIALARRAAAEGADGVLCVGPYYNKPTQAGYFAHFSAIAEAIDVPVIAYNVPGRTAGNIEAATVLRMAEEIPAIAGIKEASGNMTQIMEILKHRPAGFGVWSGDDAITVPLIALGADGIISVISNEAPAQFSKMVRLALTGKMPQAVKLHFALLDLMNINFVESSPIPVKAALAMMGRISEEYRLPLVRISDVNRAKLRRVLKAAGLL
jgi:4-hydroxy-tetrahydrodipicolinate synthase